MFSTATANFVRQIDPEGSLIHVSRVNDSHKLVPMALVVKRNRYWFWQRPKYQPTDFTLSDLLQGDATLIPEVKEKPFLTYRGTYGDELSGRLDTEAASVSVTLEGRGSSHLQSCFGKLKKEELDVIKLLRDSRNRMVDMNHVLVQQMEKRAEVLTVLKERIFTTDSCSVTQTKKEQCIFQGLLGLMGMLGGSIKACLKESSKIEADSDVSLEIPSGTVVAYSVLELKIKKNGDYDICLRPGTNGGIEADSPVTQPSHDFLDTVDGKHNGQKAPETEPSSASQNGSHEMDFSLLAELPQSVRSAFFKRLQETLRDRGALSYLQRVLENLCFGETLITAKDEDLPDSQRKTLSAILDGYSEDSQAGIPAHLNSVHLLVSAMEELPDETLNLLSESSPDFLEAFKTLVTRLKESHEPLSIQCLPVLLQDNQAFQQADQLLRSIKVTLKRDANTLWTETGNKAGVLPVVLCLSIQGLASLCKGLEM
ncbi:gasdermin-E-like [Cheilinus undulatus]|uniref:gasdermin-E-like n=1 Tax=Cheilinus undulatus TaxID=241271 RepID=UPI001BD5F9C5|nr:gasdermin-E-like [Cheilinus undulatus]